MFLNDFNNPIFSSEDLIKEIYKGNIDKISESIVDENDPDILKYLEFIDKFNLLDWPIPSIEKKPRGYIKTEKYVDDQLWFIPKEYIELDIENLLLSMCKSNAEKSRVNIELALFKRYNMIIVLKFLKYFVDIMRKNNILWGLGRGSSVASFCLYLLGVHKIDSLKYNLDISEFFH